MRAAKEQAAGRDRPAGQVVIDEDQHGAGIRPLLGPAVAGDEVLGEPVDVRHRLAGLVELGGEDQGVGGLADAGLLGGLELGGADVLKSLDDPTIRLCAFAVHFGIRSLGGSSSV